MGANSKIEWTTHTFNPWIGCQRVAPGCEHCYAEALAKRTGRAKWGPQGTRSKTSEANWREPIKWNRDASFRKDLGDEIEQNTGTRPECYAHRPRVFCASLADVFEDWDGQVSHHSSPEVKLWRGVESGELAAGVVCDEPEKFQPVGLDGLRRDLFGLIDATPHLDWLLLTKRPENVRRMWPALNIQRNEPIGDEEWRPIPGHDPYLASTHGRIKGPRGILAGDVGDQGHRRVTMHGPGGRRREQVYRLVLLAFVGPPPTPEAQGRHLDRDTSNNCLRNLAWGTQSDNWTDSKQHGTHRRYSKLTEQDVASIRTRYADGESFASIARDCSVSATQIANVCKGEQWDTLPFRANCWLGTSISDQATADKNIPELLKLRDICPVLFLSAEPLLGPVNLGRVGNDFSWTDALTGEHRELDGPSRHDEDGMPCTPVAHSQVGHVDWLIIGGESGHGARPMHPDWARSLRDQCIAADVPFFFKQWGEWQAIYDRDVDDPDWRRCSEISAKTPRGKWLNAAGGSGFHGERLVRVVPVGKKAAGRLLDGREWSEFPKIHDQAVAQ